MIFRTPRALSNKVCDALVSFGVRQNKTTFISHPGIYLLKRNIRMCYIFMEKKECLKMFPPYF